MLFFPQCKSNLLVRNRIQAADERNTYLPFCTCGCVKLNEKMNGVAGIFFHLSHLDETHDPGAEPQSPDFSFSMSPYWVLEKHYESRLQPCVKRVHGQDLGMRYMQSYHWSNTYRSTSFAVTFGHMIFLNKISDFNRHDPHAVVLLSPRHFKGLEIKKLRKEGLIQAPYHASKI